MEKYVENYFEKLKDFEENSSKFVALRKKEANFVSLLSESLNDVLKGTEPYLGFNGRNREETFGSVHKEALQIHKKNRKQILELYSKDSNTADKLYIYLKNNMMNFGLKLRIYTSMVLLIKVINLLNI